MASGRDERGQRIRVGLTGLAAVLVLVAAIAAVLDGMRDEEGPANAAQAVVANAAQPNEPLAEIGVVPATVASNTLDLTPTREPEPIQPTPPPQPLD